MSAYTFTELDAPDLSPDTLSMLADLRKARRASSPIESPRACPALGPDEVRCLRGVHEVDGQRDGRTCRLSKYLAERQRLSDALALCGYGPDRDALADPVGVSLLKAIDQSRDAAQAGDRGVRDLRRALGMVRELLVAGSDHAPHLHLVGDTGTAKTMIAAGLYFCWLWDGARAHWVVNADLRGAAKQRLSVIESTQDQARDWLATMRRYPVLFLSDLGAQCFDRRARDAGSTELAGLLLDLLDNYSGRLIWDSNLTTDELRAHADFGPRVVSRLMATRRGSPIDIICLWGADQRQHGLGA